MDKPSGCDIRNDQEQVLKPGQAYSDRQPLVSDPRLPEIQTFQIGQAPQMRKPDVGDLRRPTARAISGRSFS